MAGNGNPVTEEPVTGEADGNTPEESGAVPVPEPEPDPDTETTGSADTPATGNPGNGTPVGVLPVTGMAVGGVGSAGAALYTAGGLWGLAAGGVAAAAVGVAVARRSRSRRGLLGGGRLGRGLAGGLPRAGRGGLGRGAGVGARPVAARSGGARAGGVPTAAASRGRRPGQAAAEAVRGRRAAAAGLELGGGRGNGRAGGGNPLTGTSGSRGRRGGASHGRPHGGLPTPGKPTSPGGRTGNSRSGNGGTGPLTGKQRGAHRSPQTGSDGLTPAERAAARRAHRAVAAPRTLAGRAADRARRWAYSRLSRTRSGRMLLRGGRAAGWLVAGVTRLCARAATWSWKKLSPHARVAWTWLASAVRATWAEMAVRNRGAAVDRLRTGFSPELREKTSSGGRRATATTEEVIVVTPAQIRIRDAANELAEAIAAYNEEGMLDFVTGLDEIPGALAIVAAGVRRLAQTSMEEQPLHPGVVEAIEQVANGQANLAMSSMLLGHLARTLHAEDLERLFRRLPNGHKWDHTYNQL